MKLKLDSKKVMFTDQEVYRLKKLVTKAKAALIEDDDEFHKYVHFFICYHFSVFSVRHGKHKYGGH